MTLTSFPRTAILIWNLTNQNPFHHSLLTGHGLAASLFRSALPSTYKKKAKRQTMKSDEQNVPSHRRQRRPITSVRGRPSAPNTRQRILSLLPGCSHQTRTTLRIHRSQVLEVTEGPQRLYTKSCNFKERCKLWHCTLFYWRKAECHDRATNATDSRKLLWPSQFVV